MIILSFTLYWQFPSHVMRDGYVHTFMCKRSKKKTRHKQACCSPEKQFQQKKTFALSYDYMYTITLFTRNISIIFSSFIYKNLSLHREMLWTKIGWNWQCGSGGDFQIFFTYVCFFVIIFPWKRVWPCIWTISLLSPFGKGTGPLFEQIWIPFTLQCFVPNLAEIGREFLEKKTDDKR